MIRPARLMMLPEDIALCEDLAMRRPMPAERNNRKPKNNAPIDSPWAFAICRHGVFCECAGWLYLRPCEWFQYAEEVAGLADYEGWIDAKGIRQRHHHLLVQRDDPDDWAYLLIYSGDHPWYEIMGWCWGREAKTAPVRDPIGQQGGDPRPCHFVPQDAPFMKSPVLLYDELRQRQALIQVKEQTGDGADGILSILNEEGSNRNGETP